MTYDRRDIMTTAWAKTREMMRFLSYARHQLGEVFRVELIKAWRAAKKAAALAARSADSLRAEILHLENSDYLGHEGLQLLGTLRHALSAALARDEAEVQAAKRALIASAGGRWCVVTFTKADGSERVMRLQPASLRLHVKGEAASEAARKAVATRAARHPHLMPVWDADNKAPRSVNLATVSRIAVNGTIHEFRAN